jgi:hypothetical protein
VKAQVKAIVGTPIQKGEGNRIGVMWASFADDGAVAEEAVTRILQSASLVGTFLGEGMDPRAKVARASERDAGPHPLLVGRRLELDEVDGYVEWQPRRSSLGGDYYLHRRIGDGRDLFVVGDCTGKGDAATQLMLPMLMAWYGVAHQQFPGLEACFSTVSGLANEWMLSGTCIAFVVDRRGSTGKIRVVSAGHPPLIIARRKDSGAGFDVELLPQANEARRSPFGMGFNENVIEETATIGEGDMIVAYTDGITEAATPGRGIELATTGVISAVVSRWVRPDNSAERIARAIVAAVRKQTRGLGPGDDMTLLVLRVASKELNRPDRIRGKSRHSGRDSPTVNAKLAPTARPSDS